MGLSSHAPSYGCLASSGESIQPENTRRTISIKEPVRYIFEKLLARALEARWGCASGIVECLNDWAEALKKICG
jgi:hypothetical protein